MFKRYYTDMITDSAVSPRQAFRFFCQVDDWQDWSSVIYRARLFGGRWEPGATLLFMPSLGKLPPLPLLVKIYEVQENRCITWGLDLPVGRLLHRFTFIPAENGGSRIHHEEWSEGVMTLLALPAAGLIRKFNDRFARELAAMF